MVRYVAHVRYVPFLAGVLAAALAGKQFVAVALAGKRFVTVALAGKRFVTVALAGYPSYR